MKLREVTIKNFRCLADVSVPIDDTTILVGENNSGKSAFIDALRIVFARTTAARGTVFDEYDYHMRKPEDTPQTCEPIVVELWFQEDKSDEWPDTLVQALSEVIQTDPITDLDSIGLRLSSECDPTTGDPVDTWNFLTLGGAPVGGRGARSANLSTFLNYQRLFHMSAHRDAAEAFSPRSQYWGRILRDMKISDDQRVTLNEELERLNEDLLKADPRLGQVVASLTEVQRITGFVTNVSASIQALPLKPWELMSKSQVVMKSHGSEIDFPLSRHGEGTQSLAVLFLFQAYLNVLLKPTFHPETEAILALEEPEAHLHPQATRAFAANLEKISGQKIISSHSPYFIQEIPFHNIRLFRRDGASTKVTFVKQHFIATLPNSNGLSDFCSENAFKYAYHKGTSTLTLRGRMLEDEFRQLIVLFKDQM